MLPPLPMDHPTGRDVAVTTVATDVIPSPVARVLAVCSAVPPNAADPDFATAAAQSMSCQDDQQAEKLAKLYRRSGVGSRGSVLIQQDDMGEFFQSFYPPMKDCENGPATGHRNDRFIKEAPALACRAGADALAKSGVKPDEVTQLITITCTGFYSPGIDIELIERLGLPATTERTQVGFMGCHALINGLRVARGLVAAQPDACVLVVSVELCSLHYQYGYDAQKIVSGSLFADGAAGVVVVGRDFRSDSRYDKSDSGFDDECELGASAPIAEISATGSCWIPNSRDEMTWKIGDHGFEMTLSARVPGLVEQHLRAFLTRWLDQQGETIESIGGWAVHPGGKRIVQAVQNSLDLDDEQVAISIDILQNHGNMSSATLGAVLERFELESIPRPWLMLGFGPGLEIEVALLH